MGSLGATLFGPAPARAAEPHAPSEPVLEPLLPVAVESDAQDNRQDSQQDSSQDPSQEVPLESEADDRGEQPELPAEVEGRAQDGDELAFDRISLSEIEEMGRRTFETTQEPPEPFMHRKGVDDPFPDGYRRSRLQHVIVPLTVSLGLIGGGATMAHLALNPDCETAGEIASCSVPNGADIGVRGGRALAAVGFGLGGAVFGVLGGRELGYRLQQDSRRTLEQRRRMAIGLGTTSVVLGTAGVIAGSVLLAQGIHGARSVGDQVEDTQTADEALPYGDAALGHVTEARAGFMLLVSTPALIGMGASLLAHRPRRARVSLSPNVSSTHAGIMVRGRF